MISVETMFRRVLSKVRKSHIGTLTPEDFNRLISEALQEFKRQFWLDYEANRVSIDLLFPLKTYVANPTISNNSYTLANDWWKPAHIKIRAEYNNNPILYPDRMAQEEWIDCRELKSGERAVLKNPFKKSNHKRAYFELRGTQIDFFLEEGVNIVEAQIEYYRVPREIWFDRTNMPDNNNYPDPLGAINPYNAGYGSINTELNTDVKTMLIDMAADIYKKEIGMLAPNREN